MLHTSLRIIRLSSLLHLHTHLFSCPYSLRDTGIQIISSTSGLMLSSIGAARIADGRRCSLSRGPRLTAVVPPGLCQAAHRPRSIQTTDTNNYTNLQSDWRMRHRHFFFGFDCAADTLHKGGLESRQSLKNGVFIFYNHGLMSVRSGSSRTVKAEFIFGFCPEILLLTTRHLDDSRLTHGPQHTIINVARRYVL